MPSTIIKAIQTHDMRFALEEGAGADSVHSDPQYSYAVTQLKTGQGVCGIGLAFTLGGGNELVCKAIQALSGLLVGREIEALMADFGAVYRQILDHPQYRWLGPHKGVVHLALSSIVNACFDLWAKARAVPLWRLLLDLRPEQLAQHPRPALPRRCAHTGRGARAFDGRSQESPGAHGHH